MSDVKYHVNPETGRANQCQATVKACKFATEDYMPPHFNTKEDAKKHAETMMEQKHGMFSGVNRKKSARSSVVETTAGDTIRNARVMDAETAFLKDSLAEMAGNLIEVRAQNGQATFNNGDPEKAQKRLQEAINFATKRDNTHLVKKLSRATVLPSGAFKLSDGTSFNTDTLLKASTAEKFVSEARSYYENTLSKIAADSDLPAGHKFSFKDDSGSYTMTIKDGKFNEDAFNKLPSDVRESISSSRDSYDIDLVREKLSPELQKEILKDGQAMDYIIGKSSDIGQSKVSFNKEYEGNTAEAKLESGLRNVAELYSTAHVAFNDTQSNLKKRKTSMTSAVKSVAAVNGNNVFAPSRSASNGALVYNRQTIDRAALEEKLSADQIASVTTTKASPDADKAKKVLSPEDYNKIFNARRVEFRVTEAKRESDGKDEE